MIELPNKRIRSLKKEKQMKGTKGESQEIHNIQAEIIKRIILLYRWSEKKKDAKQIILHKR